MTLIWKSGTRSHREASNGTKYKEAQKQRSTPYTAAALKEVRQYLDIPDVPPDTLRNAIDPTLWMASLELMSTLRTYGTEHLQTRIAAHKYSSILWRINTSSVHGAALYDYTVRQAGSAPALVY